MPDSLHALLAAADAVSLVSWLKPLLMLVTILPWLWVASRYIEKDTRYFHYGYHLWNGLILGGAVAAVAAMLLIPIFWIGWPLGIALAAAPVLIYWKYRNDRAPEDERFYLTSDSFTARMQARKASKSQKEATIVFMGPDKKPLAVPGKDDPLLEVHMLAEQMIEPALQARASRVEVGPTQGGYVLLHVIDGVRVKRESLPTEAANRAIDYIKRVAQLDVEDRRRRQTGAFRFTWPGGDVDANLAVSGSSAGQTMRLDFDRSNRISVPFDNLGLLAPQQEALNSFMDPGERHGLVLFSAPAGHGLTTSGYALIARHDAFTANIKTLEREVELELDGVDHITYEVGDASDFATNLQSILRRDPDIVMVADVRDPGVATIAAEPALRGPLVYVPMIADSVPAAYTEWVRAVGDVKAASKGVLAIVNQRLLRQVCPHCRQAYQPTPEQAKKLGLGGSKATLYRAGGKVQVKNKVESCPVCNGIGYFGQTAVFEVMPVDEETRRLLSGGDFKGAYGLARRNRMIYLQEAALMKVREGVTTVEEVARVLSPARSESRPAGKEPAPAG